MAQLLSTNVSGTLAVTQNTTVSGNLIVSGYNVLNEIFQADNLARVTANSGTAQSAVSLNFVNTATVLVSVTSGGTGVANIGFTSTVSGGVSSVAAGIGLTSSPNPIISSGTISANIASTTGQGVTKLIDSVTTNDSANAATGAAVKIAYDQATSAYGQANSAYAQANTANSTAISAYGQANSGYAQANSAYNQANAAYTQANSAYGQANAAFVAANNAANTVRVTANSGTAQSAVSLNFVNTATIRVNVGAGAVGNANVSFDYIGSGTTTFPVSGNTSGPTISANGINFNNTSTIRVTVGSGVTGNANVSFDYIGSVSGGSGINNFPVSANSGSTVTANGLNFLNSSSILVSVSVGGGSTGNADVSFSAVAGTTSVPGIVQLTDSVTSTSTTTAATPNSVRLAFNQATTAYGQANVATNRTQVSANSGSIKTNVAVNFVNTASIFVSVTDGTTGNANVEFSLNTTALRTIWVPAQSMAARTTAGAASGTTESTTNRVMAKTFDFDTATQEFVQFSVRMPKSWNLGTVSFAPYWTAVGTTAGTVAWTLAGVALSDNQAIDTAFGTSQTSSDTWQTADFVHIGPEPATPITIGNTPVAGDIVFFQVSRDVANDTLDRDAKLLGIALFVTVNARDDT